METTVCLAWATKKRHIAINGNVICESERKTSGYSVKNGQYNTISLSGLPDYKKTTNDEKFSHSDGIIEYLLLDKQSVKIDTTSICSICIKKYQKLFA